VTAEAEYRPVDEKYLREGETILLGQVPYSVVFRRPRQRNGRVTFVVENQGTGNRSNMWCDKGAKIFRLHIPRQDVGLAKGWKIRHGDVVIYPGRRGAPTVAAIRHLAGWYTTTTRRTPLPDAKVLQDVREGTARVVRNDRLRPALDTIYTYQVGSVVAVRDETVPDPTVWVCTEKNVWRSSTGVEASDQMIRYEMGRDTYLLVAVRVL
jgi:hypothetical protein